MRRVLSLLLLFPASVAAQSSSDPLPVGYSWSAPLGKPPALAFNSRQSYGYANPAGLYDYMVQTVGDNWCASNPTGYATINQPAGANASVRFSSDVQDQSCGWLCWRRGPYVAGTAEANRGAWKVGCPENAGPWPMVSMPIITHHAGDFRRYWTNGWPFLEATYFSSDGPFGQFYKRTQAIGPLQLDGTRKPLPDPAARPPDLTLLSAVPNIPVYVAYCWVDQFGREGPLSDPLLIPAIQQAGGNNATTLEVGRPCQPPQGACSLHLYAGPGLSGLFRQRIIDNTANVSVWDWPLHLTRFYLHELRTDVPWSPPTSKAAQSWLNPIQQAVEANQNLIFKPGTWQLYCPLILKYDPSNFSRVIGDPSQRVKLVQSTSFPSPAVILLNQRDRLQNLDITATGCAAITTSDFSGGQAFSNELIGCTFTNGAQDGYGICVDECSSVGWGNHTCSELLIRHCTFTAARPVKLEGRQTAKVRCDDRCTFNCNGASHYPNEVCALEVFTSNLVAFDTIEGVNGMNNFRTFVGMYSNEGGPSVRVRDVFMDRGCSVAFAYGPSTGGRVDLSDGDKLGIYPTDRNWFRLAEAPNCLSASLKCRNLQFPESSSILAYNLNSFVSDLDRPLHEIVTPSNDEWVARGLPLSFAGKDWTIKPVRNFIFGFYGITDTINRQTTNAAVSTSSPSK